MMMLWLIGRLVTDALFGSVASFLIFKFQSAKLVNFLLMTAGSLGMEFVRFMLWPNGIRSQ